MMNTNDQMLLNEAMTKALNLTKGEVFLLQELLNENQWQSLESPNQFGKEFRQLIENSSIARFHDKTTENRNRYERL